MSRGRHHRTETATVQEQPSWRVAVDGKLLEETFADEEAANYHAATRRQSSAQKIATFVPGSARHLKAIASGAAPSE